jgi:hypothetical protein
MGGQFWVGWYWGSPSYVSYFREVCGLRLPPAIEAAAEAYADTCSSASWWWPHRDFVIVSERPLWIDRDEQGRLHSTTRRAIEWPDGFGVYRIHGVTVPEWMVLNPERVSVATIDAETNQEIRRIQLEIYGLARYVLDSRSEVVHEDVDSLGHPRRLLRHNGMLFVAVKNSTLEPDGSRKNYILAVHPELRPIPPRPRAGERPLTLGEPQALTCHNAVASTFYLRGEQYAPEVET